MANANDNFTEASDKELSLHASDSGHSWTKYSGHSGSATVVGSTDNVKDTSGNAPTYYISAVPASAEYDVQCDTTGAGDCAGPAGRIATGADTCYRVIWVNGASEWRLVKRVAGTNTTLATYAGDDPDGVSRTVKLQIRDAAKKVFIGGVERISSTNNDITDAGRGGIRFSGVTTDRLDNWSATDSATVHNGAIAVTGSGSVSCAGLRVALGAVAPSGSGSAAVSGVRVAFGAAAVSGLASVAAAAVRVALGTISASAAASVSASATRVFLGVIADLGNAVVTAAATLIAGSGGGSRRWRNRLRALRRRVFQPYVSALAIELRLPRLEVRATPTIEEVVRRAWPRTEENKEFHDWVFGAGTVKIEARARAEARVDTRDEALQVALGFADIPDFR